jgi:hypothetical protein
MPKDITIKEDGVATPLNNIAKVRANNIDGGSTTWIPLDDAERAVLTAKRNGTYAAQSYDYQSFSKYIRREYFKEVADAILKADDFIIDYDKTISWIDYFGHEQNFIVSLETVAI